MSNNEKSVQTNWKTMENTIGGDAEMSGIHYHRDEYWRKGVRMMNQPTVLCQRCKNAGPGIKTLLLFVLCLRLVIPAKNKCFLKLVLCAHRTWKVPLGAECLVLESPPRRGERLLAVLNMHFCVTTPEARLAAVKSNSVFTYTVKMEDIHQSWGFPDVSWWRSGLQTALKRGAKKSLIGCFIELSEDKYYR